MIARKKPPAPLPFRVVAVMAQKGGVGKTTLAVHLAVAGAFDGEIVELVDCDPQRSALMWSQAREGKPPPVLAVDPAELGRIVADAKRRGVTLLVIDTAPRLDTHALRAAQLADFVLIPCRPSAFDFAAAAASVEIVRKSGTRAAFVLSSCPFRAPEIADARASLAAHGIPVCPIDIIERRDYARAIPSGEAVAEFAPHGKAASEIAALWTYTREALTHAVTD